MNTVTTVAAEAATAVAKVHPGRLASSLVIFAAGVDWTKRLVVLCDLVEAGRLPFLIWDAILFQRADPVGAAWRAVEGWLNSWTSDPAKDFPGYAAGREGPAASDRLAGARWAPRGGDQGWPRTHGNPPVTRLHQSIEVAL
jgi:Glucose-6-phosphate dehydrogenase, C-terminal domain